MIVVIDNYDSFTYNLVQYLGALGATLAVYRNDKVTPDEVAALQPSHVVISPGPGEPTDGGISIDLIRRLHREVPILGVCLGHQCMAYAFGGSVVRAPRQMHGKVSPIHHEGRGLYHNLPNPFIATRYHSLIVAPPLPPGFVLTAWTAEGEIMGIRHERHPLHGVQFHPESILTAEGKQFLANFLALSLPVTTSGSPANVEH